jgi:hypothetical protein
VADLQWGPVCDWCQISASVDRESYKATENVLATVIVKNVSARTVGYPAYPFAPGNDYEVTQDGTAIPLTAYGKRMRASANDLREGAMPLKPGDDIVYELFLNRDFDLTLAGRYQLRVTRETAAGPSQKPAMANSNTVEFEIVDDR